MYSWRCDSAEETMDFAKKLSAYLHQGDVLTLDGDLGAGKTTFTKGLAKGLGITDVVSSPTFTIIKEYQGRIPLYHMDVYRISGEEDLGFDEYFDGPGVSVVEWADIIEDYLPEERLELTIRLTGPDSREITLTPVGKRYAQTCEELTNHEHFSD